jgi:hypothetical protein
VVTVAYEIPDEMEVGVNGFVGNTITLSTNVIHLARQRVISLQSVFCNVRGLQLESYVKSFLGLE